MEENKSTSCSSCGSWWRLPLLLILVLAAVVLTRGWGIWNAPPQDAKKTKSDSTAAPTTNVHVLLAINFAIDRRKDFDPLPWHEGMTAEDQLRSAPGVEVTQTGTGATALLTAINGIANEGVDGSNWTYEVNGQSADRSFAIYELHPNDRVLWTFGPRR